MQGFPLALRIQSTITIFIWTWTWTWEAEENYPPGPSRHVPRWPTLPMHRIIAQRCGTRISSFFTAKVEPSSKGGPRREGGRRLRFSKGAIPPPPFKKPLLPVSLRRSPPSFNPRPLCAHRLGLGLGRWHGFSLHRVGRSKLPRSSFALRFSAAAVTPGVKERERMEGEGAKSETNGWLAWRGSWGAACVARRKKSRRQR